MSAPTAIIFDMDETLFDTVPIWRKAEVRLFESLGSAFDPEIARQYKGMNARDLGRTVWRMLQPAGLTEEECAERSRDYLIEVYNEGAPFMPGAEAFLNQVSGRYPLAVASGSPRQGIETVLKAAGCYDRFGVIISSEEVSKGKPAPDVFLEAARLLNIDPGRCLVLEDAYNGLLAAKTAGMACFMVPSHADNRIAELADRVFGSLGEIREEQLAQL